MSVQVPQIAMQQDESHQFDRFFAVEYAGYWHIQTSPYYDSGLDILNAEDVGVSYAKERAELIAKLLNDYHNNQK